MKLPSNKRIAVVTIILTVYIIVIWVYYPTISGTYNDIMKSPQPRTFQIPIFFDLKGSVGFINQSDVEIGLTITYPNGTLVINEPVDVTATVVLRDVAIKEIGEVDFAFQNWLQYPTFHDVLGIPQQGSLNFPNPNEQYYSGNLTPSPNLRIVITANTTVYWPIEGDYKPLIELLYFDGTKQAMTIDTVVLHVYPQEQLTQIETNQASISLAVVVLIFSTVGIIALVVQILDRSETQCKYPESHTDDNQAARAVTKHTKPNKSNDSKQQQKREQKANQQQTKHA